MEHILNFKNSKWQALSSSKKEKKKKVKGERGHEAGKVKAAHQDFPKMADTTLLSCLSSFPIYKQEKEPEKYKS